MSRESTVPEEPIDRQASPPDPSSFPRMPRFPGAEDDIQPPITTNRMKSWGKAGAIWGAACGTFLALAVLLSLGRWASDPLEVFGVLLGSPVLFAVLGGAWWGLLGMIRDVLM